VKRLDITVTLDDGQVLTVRSRAADLVRYETEAGRRGWGTISSAPNTWETAVAYFALLRTKQVSLPWEKFLEQLADVDTDIAAAPEVAPLPKELSVVS
jgi:L-alanine-DL-glutamate epimerase-like enolase superfamily enzyme